MKNLVFIENDNTYKFDSLEELYELIFGKKYFNLTEKEKLIRRYEIAFYKIKFCNLNFDIVHTKIGKLGDRYKVISSEYELDNAFIIDNEKEFVLSLCKFPFISVLENKYYDGLFSVKEKEQFKGNYIIINKDFFYKRKGN